MDRLRAIHERQRKRDLASTNPLSRPSGRLDPSAGKALLRVFVSEFAWRQPARNAKRRLANRINYNVEIFDAQNKPQL